MSVFVDNMVSVFVLLAFGDSSVHVCECVDIGGAGECDEVEVVHEQNKQENTAL